MRKTWTGKSIYLPWEDGYWKQLKWRISQNPFGIETLSKEWKIFLWYPMLLSMSHVTKFKIHIILFWQGIGSFRFFMPILLYTALIVTDWQLCRSIFKCVNQKRKKVTWDSVWVLFQTIDSVSALNQWRKLFRIPHFCTFIENSCTNDLVHPLEWGIFFPSQYYVLHFHVPCYMAKVEFQYYAFVAAV